MAKDDGLDRFTRNMSAKQAINAAKDHKNRNDKKKKKKKEDEDKRKAALKNRLTKKS